MCSLIWKMPKSKGFLMLFIVIVAMTGNTNAQEESIVEEIVVPGRAIDTLDLNSTSSTGSRLGLTIMETPASVELIDSSVMRARGYKSVADAVKSLPGVTSGESPAAPSTFSMRGFSRSSITVLRDGIWLGPANMVMRPQNTFNLDRIEVLRGPGLPCMDKVSLVAPSTLLLSAPPIASSPSRCLHPTGALVPINSVLVVIHS